MCNKNLIFLNKFFYGKLFKLNLTNKKKHVSGKTDEWMKWKKTIFKKTLFLEQKKNQHENLYYNFATEFTVFFNSFLRQGVARAMFSPATTLSRVCWWKQQFVNISVIKCVETWCAMLFYLVYLGIMSSALAESIIDDFGIILPSIHVLAINITLDGDIDSAINLKVKAFVWELSTCKATIVTVKEKINNFSYL